MVMFSIFDVVKDNLLSVEEVEWVKKGLLKDFNLQMCESVWVGCLISEFIVQGDWCLGFIYCDCLEQVIFEQVVEVVVKYLVLSNCIVGCFIFIEKLECVEIFDVLDISVMVDGYEGCEMVFEGEVFEVFYDNIDSCIKIGEVDKILEYVFLLKEICVDVVCVCIFLCFGFFGILDNC